MTLIQRFSLHISINEKNHSSLLIDDDFAIIQYAHVRCVLPFNHIFIAYFQYENLRIQSLNVHG